MVSEEERRHYENSGRPRYEYARDRYPSETPDQNAHYARDRRGGAPPVYDRQHEPDRQRFQKSNRFNHSDAFSQSQKSRSQPSDEPVRPYRIDEPDDEDKTPPEKEEIRMLTAPDYDGKSGLHGYNTTTSPTTPATEGIYTADQRQHDTTPGRRPLRASRTEGPYADQYDGAHAQGRAPRFDHGYEDVDGKYERARDWDEKVRQRPEPGASAGSRHPSSRISMVESREDTFRKSSRYQSKAEYGDVRGTDDGGYSDEERDWYKERILKGTEYVQGRLQSYQPDGKSERKRRRELERNTPLSSDIWDAENDCPGMKYMDYLKYY